MATYFCPGGRNLVKDHVWVSSALEPRPAEIEQNWTMESDHDPVSTTFVLRRRDACVVRKARLSMDWTPRCDDEWRDLKPQWGSIDELHTVLPMLAGTHSRKVQARHEALCEWRHLIAERRRARGGEERLEIQKRIWALQREARRRRRKLEAERFLQRGRAAPREGSTKQKCPACFEPHLPLRGKLEKIATWATEKLRNGWGQQEYRDWHELKDK